MRWWTGLFVVAVCAVCALGCKDDLCEETRQHRLDCDWVLNEEVCEDEQWLCSAACANELTCNELDAYAERGQAPPEVRRCQIECNVFRCDDGTEVAGGVRCDGNVQCLDRSDERTCEYVECNGEAVPAWWSCDAGPPFEPDAGGTADAGR